MLKRIALERCEALIREFRRETQGVTQCHPSDIIEEKEVPKVNGDVSANGGIVQIEKKEVLKSIDNVSAFRELIK